MSGISTRSQKTQKAIQQRVDNTAEQTVANSAEGEEADVKNEDQVQDQEQDTNTNTNTASQTVNNWKKEEVCNWLYTVLGSSMYREAFIREEITGDVLVTFTMNDLTAIGVTTYGHRKKIMNGIQGLLREDGIAIQTHITAVEPSLSLTSTHADSTHTTMTPMHTIASDHITPHITPTHTTTIPMPISNTITTSNTTTSNASTSNDEIASSTELLQQLKLQSAQSAQLAQKAHKKPIPLFHGNKNDIAGYKLFKQDFKRYLEFKGIHQSFHHNVLTDALKSKAALWFSAYTESHPNITSYNYEQLMVILDTEYLNPLAASKYQYMYETMTTQFGESVQDLVTRIDNLATQAGKTIRSDQEKKLKLFTLLPSFIQSSLIAQLHDDSIAFEQFYTIASHSKDHNDAHYQKRKQANGHVHSAPQTHIVHNVNKPTNGKQYQQQQQYGKTDNRQPCIYCNRNNHPTFLCSMLLANMQMKQPEAEAFWKKHRLEEQLQKYNTAKQNNTATNNNRNNVNNNNNTNGTDRINNNSSSSESPSNTTANINHERSEQLIQLNGKLNNYTVEGILIDEGSSVSIISSELYRELLMFNGREINYNLTIHNLPTLYQADGKTKLSVKGRVELQLRFENKIIGRFPFMIVDQFIHNALIGRDITQAANLSVINDNGTQLVQGLDLLRPNIKFSDKVNIFKVNNIIRKNNKAIVRNITTMCAAMNDNNTEIINDTIHIAEQKETVMNDIPIERDIKLPEHMADITFGDISEEHKYRLKKLLCKYQDIFHKPGDPITALNTHIKHKIRLEEGAKPVRARIYPLPEAHNKIIKEQINNWLSLGIVRPSFSPWASRCILVDKKDQKAGRLCGVFCQLNDLTVMDAYPLKEIEEQKSHFAGSVIFSQIDLKDAYLQVELDEESKEKTAIIVRDGLFEFNRMIQGLKTAPATFHRIIDDSFKEVIGQCLEPYFDDLTVHSREFEEHLDHLRQVFNIMRIYGFKAKASKVKLAVSELRWLGFVISNGQMKPDSKLISSITELKAPTNVQEIRMVLGLFNFYRNFIPKFADLAAPLDDLKRLDRRFNWTKEHQLAFDTLKEKLTTYPVLRIPDVNKSFILDTDASTIGIGGILQQIDEKTNCPYVVSYFSRKLSEAEKKLGVTDLEALAMRDSIKKFSRYLIGKEFKVRTDHISLTYLRNLKTLTGKLGRISMDLQGYDYTIEYKPGRQHTNVDCLSRMPTTEEEENKITVNSVSVNNKADLSAFIPIQQADSFTVEVIKFIQSDQAVTQNTDIHIKIKEYLFSNKNLHFKVEDSILKVHDKRIKNDHYQIVIPDADQHMQLQLTQLIHNPQHQGVQKLYKIMRDKFFWTTMKTYITNYVDSCKVCQKTKRDYHNDIIQKNMILNQSAKDSDIMCEPLSQITIDHLDLPITDTGYKCLLVIIDRATRLVKAIPCKTHEATEFIDNLIEHWIFAYGVPRVILSDRGSAFVGSLMKQLSKILQIDHVLSTPYNPQSHGLVERSNQSIQQIMRALLLAHHDAEKNWDKYVNHVVFVMNTTINKSTGYTPYELIYGRKACYPIDRLLNDDEVFNSVGDYLQDLITRHRINYSIVHSNLLTQKQKNELYNNENTHKIRIYDVGDLVYKAKYTRKNKLEPLYEGPYVIVKKINDLCYQIKLRDNDLAPLLLANIRHLKPFIDESEKIIDATQARNTIDDIMKEFNSISQYRRPITHDDFMSDAEFDLIYNE